MKLSDSELDRLRPQAIGTLTQYRYAVAVSHEQVQTPDDVTRDGIVHLHLNVAVNPRSPSKS